MIEIPTLFSAPMVRANRLGVDPKTVTRRTRGLDKINENPDAWEYVGVSGGVHRFRQPYLGKGLEIRCPYGVAGDRLVFRESYRLPVVLDRLKPSDVQEGTAVWYEADGTAPREFGKLRPGMFMCRWMMRDEGDVVSAGPERLHVITEAEAIAEGMCEAVGDFETSRSLDKWCNFTARAARAQGRPRPLTADMVGAFACLWERINGPGSWAKNPWVWRVEYRRLVSAVEFPEAGGPE